MKLAIIIMSDPKNGDEALGRVFNALATAAEAHEKKDQVEVVFQGAGTRWPAELAKASNPVHGLYTSLRPVIAGASSGCAAFFGSTDSVKACGLPELKDHLLGGAMGLASIRRYAAEGWTTLVF